eukprot:SAG31_NODE_2511_length_5585_cov_2.160408_3_plen_210_part_00
MRIAMEEVKSVLGDFDKIEVWQKGRENFLNSVSTANKEQMAAIAAATKAEVAARASTQLQAMKAKIGLSRQAAMQRVDSSVKELAEDYEKQERELTQRIAEAKMKLENLEVEQTAASNMLNDNTQVCKDLDEEAKRAEKQMLVKIRMLTKRKFQVDCCIAAYLPASTFYSRRLSGLAEKRVELEKSQQRIKDLERELSKRERCVPCTLS